MANPIRVFSNASSLLHHVVDCLLDDLPCRPGRHLAGKGQGRNHSDSQLFRRLPVYAAGSRGQINKQGAGLQPESTLRVNTRAGMVLNTTG